MLTALLAFAAAAAVLTITPGVDTAIVLRTAAQSARAAFGAAFGVCSGLFVWGAGAAFGLGALLAASATAFFVLKLAGAAYLFVLGVRLIVRPRASLSESEARGGEQSAFRRGFFTNVLNPKVGVFYATFLPQFIPAGANVAAFSLALAAVHAALALIWFSTLIAMTVPLGQFLRRPRVVQALDRLTGCVFVGFGARLALAHRG